MVLGWNKISDLVDGSCFGHALIQDCILPHWKVGTGVAFLCWGRYVLEVNSDSLNPPHLQAFLRKPTVSDVQVCFASQMSTACHLQGSHSSVVAHQSHWSIFIKCFDIPDERTVYKCPIHLGDIQ